MATYGISATPGTVPFTGYTPTLGNGPANQDATSGAVQFNGITQNDYAMMNWFGTQANRRFLALLKSITGVAPGATSTDTYRRVTNGHLGGAVATEVVTTVNRTTTAADVTAFTALWNRVVNPTTYPADLSGNGGGGKQQVAGGAY